jgi:hypothetical protein
MTTRLLALTATIAFLSGCAVPYYPRGPIRGEEAAQRPAVHPISMEDVSRLAKAGISDDIIIAKIRNDGVTARPTTDQIVALKKEGVSDRVIEAVVSAQVAPSAESHPAAVVRYEAEPAYDLWWHYDPWWRHDYWWYGWPYPYWHYGYPWRYRR